MFFRDKEMAEWVGLVPSSISKVRKNHKKLYALYRMGYASVLENPDDTRWQKVKNKDIALYLSKCARTFSHMKKANPRKYEILKRGYLSMNA